MTNRNRDLQAGLEARRLIALTTMVLALHACTSQPAPANSDAGNSDAGTSDAGNSDAGASDAGGTDAGIDAGTDGGLPVYNRTLINRPLMPTSPNNLLRDPLIGGDGATSYAQFRAFFDAADAGQAVGSNLSVALTRTFQSVSPIGGAVSIEEVRNFVTDAGVDAQVVWVVSSFHGGSGNFSASIWLSGGDINASPLPFATVSSAIQVSLLDSAGDSQVPLSASPPVQFGNREWVQFSTDGTSGFPSGGRLAVELTNLSYTLQLAAPEVLTTSLSRERAMPREATRIPMGGAARRALERSAQIDRNPSRGPPHREVDDR